MVFFARPFSTAAIARKASMDGLSKSFACVILGREILMEKFAHGFDLLRLDDFPAVVIGDIKHIGHLIHVGGNFRDVNRQSKLVQAVSDREQNADPVLGKYFDDRKIVRSLVIDIE